MEAQLIVWIRVDAKTHNKLQIPHESIISTTVQCDCWWAIHLSSHATAHKIISRWNFEEQIHQAIFCQHSSQNAHVTTAHAPKNERNWNVRRCNLANWLPLWVSLIWLALVTSVQTKWWGIFSRATKVILDCVKSQWALSMVLYVVMSLVCCNGISNCSIQSSQSNSLTHSTVSFEMLQYKQFRHVEHRMMCFTIWQSFKYSTQTTFKCHHVYKHSTMRLAVQSS